MSLVGIICASDTELEPFLKYINFVKITKKSMLEFYEGAIDNVKVVAVYSGVCKVNAAVATQILIDFFGVDIVINAGTAGGMNEQVELFDTVVGEFTAYHDVADDILTEFHPWLKSIYFKADDRLLEIIKELKDTLSHPILFGKIVTGEKFITDEGRNSINKKFNPLAVDMETASIAHVCYVNNIPFISIRTITDTVTHKGIENFEKNCEHASYISSNIVVSVINKLSYM